jgi:hypothetical protein
LRLSASAVILLSKEQKDERSVARDDDSNTKAGIKIKLVKFTLNDKYITGATKAVLLLSALQRIHGSSKINQGLP